MQERSAPFASKQIFSSKASSSSPYNLILLQPPYKQLKPLKLTASLASSALAKGLGMEGTSTELLPEKASDLGLGPFTCKQHIGRQILHSCSAAAGTFCCCWND